MYSNPVLNASSTNLAEIFKEFWDAPPSAFFNQKTVAAIRNVSEKTLERDRWMGAGIPFRKINGRVLYQKSDVIAFLEGHALVTSTSQYKEESIICQK